jgi:hypothetical protein
MSEWVICHSIVKEQDPSIRPFYHMKHMDKDNDIISLEICEKDNLQDCSIQILGLAILSARVSILIGFAFVEPVIIRHTCMMLSEIHFT